MFCPGAFHTWVGTLTYAGYTFASDAARPLEFSVKRDYTYAGGKGTVTSPDGSVRALDAAEVAPPWLATPSPSYERPTHVDRGRFERREDRITLMHGHDSMFLQNTESPPNSGRFRGPNARQAPIGQSVTN